MFLALLIPLGVIALLVYLTVRLTAVSREVRSLRERIDVLSYTLPGGAGGETREEKVSALSPSKTDISTPELTLADHAVEPRIEPPRLESGVRTRTREEWEAFVGGKVLNLIGAVALVLGVGFFLKYAFDRNWIPEEVRVLIGAAVGTGCLWGAHRASNRGFVVFAQGLVGAGIGILYLSVYASFNFYTLVPQWVAYVLMSVVTGVALFQSSRYRSISVGLLGWAGGYATPLMLSSGRVDPTGLLTYIALLTLAILSLVMLQRSWLVVHVLTLAGTWVSYAAWHIDAYDGFGVVIRLFFVLVYWALFISADVWARLRDRPFTPAHSAISAVNAAAGAFFCSIVLQPRSDSWLAVVYLLMAIVLGAAYVLGRRSPDARFTHVMSVLSIALGALAIMQWFDRYETIMALSVFGVTVAFAARELRLGHLPSYLHWAFLVLCVALLAQRHAIGFLDDILLYTPVLNERMAAFGVFILGASASAWVLRSPTYARSRAFLVSVALAAFVIIASVELNDTLRSARAGLSDSMRSLHVYRSVMILGFLWLVLGFVLLRAGRRFSFTPSRVFGVVLLACGAFLAIARGYIFIPTELFTPLWNIRSGVLLAGAGLLLAGTVVPSGAAMKRQERQLQTAALVTASCMVFTLLTGEVLDYFRLRELTLRSGAAGTDDWVEAIGVIDNLRQLSLSGIWLLYSVGLMVAGFLRASPLLRALAMSLFGCTILKIFLYDLSFLETIYRMISFVCLGIILLTVSYAYQRYRHVLFPPASGANVPPSEVS